MWVGQHGWGIAIHSKRDDRESKFERKGGQRVSLPQVEAIVKSWDQQFQILKERHTRCCATWEIKSRLGFLIRYLRSGKFEPYHLRTPIRMILANSIIAAWDSLTLPVEGLIQFLHGCTIFHIGNMTRKRFIADRVTTATRYIVGTHILSLAPTLSQ